jgi:hypothetical protein
MDFDDLAGFGSAMIPLHSSTHSSQMKMLPGPQPPNFTLRLKTEGTVEDL